MIAGSDVITLDRFVVETTLGITEFEQRGHQPLEIDLEMAVPMDAAGDTGDLTGSINYADVQQQMMTLVQAGQWRLIESIALAACRLLLLPPAPREGRAQLDAVAIRLAKPTILQGAVPGLRLQRNKAWCTPEVLSFAPGVRAHVLCATPVTGAYRVSVEAGAAWCPPPTAYVHVIAGVGHGDGAPLVHGQRIAWHGVRELVAGDHALTLLVVSRPPLDGA